MTDFTLRPWREADAASIARYADNAKIAANLRDVFPCPYAPQDAATFVESCIRQEGRGQMCRAIEVDGEAAGSIGLFLFDFVAALFGGQDSAFSRVIFALVGLAALVHFAPVPRHPRQGIKSQGPLNKRALTFFTLCHILHPRGVLTA